MKFDGIVFANCICAAADMLKLNEKTINNLNVYPVPDGDTGSNMRGTVSDAANSVKSSPCEIGLCACEFSARMLKTARGNSGAILSQFFRGFSEGLKGLTEAESKDIAKALLLGTEYAYNAVATPTEGTILTVMRESAQKADNIALIHGKDIAPFFDEICASAEEALNKTTDMLKSLKDAGVVDAGGLGFLTILRGFSSCLSGRELSKLDQEQYTLADFSAVSHEDIIYHYCVECNIAKNENFRGENKCRKLSDHLAQNGNSIVFIETEEEIKLHIHTNSPETILSEAEKFGNAENKKIEDMALQHTSLIEKSSEKEKTVPQKEYGFVFVSAGDGFNGIFEDLGADEIVFGGQTMNPSTGDILSAIEKTPAENVFVFPGNKNIILSAKQASDLVEDRKVYIIQTESLPQSVSAALAFSIDVSADENAEAMVSAAESIRTISITRAVKSATVNGQNISEGEYIGLVNGKLNARGENALSCIKDLAEEFSEAEFINIYFGSDVSQNSAKETAEEISALAPDAETELIFGGQPLYDYLISLE